MTDYFKGYQDAINETINLQAHNTSADYAHGYYDATHDLPTTQGDTHEAF